MPLQEPKNRGVRMLKPHRVVLEKVSSYSEEAAAFMRRRRHHRREFVRIRLQSGAESDLAFGTPEADRIGEAAKRLIELG